MKKKILFCINNLNVGGITKALLNTISLLGFEKYDITILIESFSGQLVADVPKEVKVIKYNLDNSSGNVFIVIKRKIKNLFKRIYWTFKLKNKYDFAACYTSYSYICSKLACQASKNNALWIHGDYYSLYNGEFEKINKFYDDVNFRKYKNIVFVSENAKKNFIKQFPELCNRSLVCNNPIDYQTILNLSKEKLDYREKRPIFINVGRHEEHTKKLSNLIKAAKMLKDDNYSFALWLVGAGVSHEQYISLVNENDLNDCVKFWGVQVNPYNILKKADYFVLTSVSEGFPVTLTESLILNKPIISTDISDARELIDGKFGIITGYDAKSIYKSMKKFLDAGYKIKKSFNCEDFNQKSLKTIRGLIDGN